MSAPLPEAFFARDALDVAHDLIGRHLRHEAVTLRITEVEAYRPGDSACHGFRGESARNRPLFGPPGRLYVYVCYGIHRMVNVVTGPEGEPQGVLIRACAPVEGLDVVAARRGGRTGPVTLTGPGKIGAALALDVAWSGHPVFEAGGVEVLPGAPAAARLIGPRVGIDYAEPVHRDAPWRVAEADSRWVSVRKTLRPL
ncbi:MAG: DNA-3-methyladenine glycosylase [Myxococcales bacterium]|nr:DNA-3-methyladenine glycosylase [Myxococcales bacterium]